MNELQWERITFLLQPRNPFSPPPGTPGEGWGEGLPFPHARSRRMLARQTLTLPSPGLPVEGKKLASYLTA